MCGHHAQNLLVLRSPQLFLLRPDHNICAGMDLYRQYAGLSPASGTAAFSQNIGPVVTWSARPAPLPLQQDCYSG